MTTYLPAARPLTLEEMRAGVDTAADIDNYPWGNVVWSQPGELPARQGQSRTPDASHWRGIVIGICLVGTFVLAWKLLDVLGNSDALAIALGISLGVLAAVPSMLLFTAMRDR